MIVVAGASGTLGPLLLPLLIARGERVRVVSRDPGAVRLKLADVDYVAGDVTRTADARRAVEGARVVVSAITGFASPAGLQAVDVEGNRVLADAAAQAGVEQYVLVSVAQASADHPMGLFRAKFAAEQAVRASGVPWTFIRPTAYMETWLGLIGRPLVATGKTMVFGRGRNPINFVSAADVAAFVDLAVADPSLHGQVVEVPGPENLTFDELVETIQAATGRSGQVSHVPRLVLRVLAVALPPFDRMRAGQVRAALVMDTRDMTMDGPTIRAAHPTIPMTTATMVAGRFFEGQPNEAVRLAEV